MMRRSDGPGFVLGLLLVSTFPLSGYTQWTVPDLVDRGSSGSTKTAPSGKPPEITDVLQHADVVVRGILGEARSFLSDDRRNVYTEYELRNAVILYQRDVFAAPTPGVIVPPLTVAILGGTITLNDRTFTQRELGLKPLKPGMEGVFLLRRMSDRYYLAREYWGGFIVSDDRLEPLTTRETFATEYRSMPAGEAAADMVSRLHALRQ